MKKKLGKDPDKEFWKSFHLNTRSSKYFTVTISKNSPRKTFIPPYCNFPILSLNKKPKKINVTLTKAIHKRETDYKLLPCIFTISKLSSLLINSYVIKDNSRFNVPSAGAIYPIQLFFHYLPSKKSPNSLKPGLYFYDAYKKQIRYLYKPNKNSIKEILFQEHLALTTSLHIFLVANFNLSCQQYSERGYKFCFLEAGHIAQNINLVATALGLKAINIGGFDELKANDLLKIDGLNSSVIYMQLIGSTE